MQVLCLSNTTYYLDMKTMCSPEKQLQRTTFFNNHVDLSRFDLKYYTRSCTRLINFTKTSDS